MFTLGEALYQVNIPGLLGRPTIPLIELLNVGCQFAQSRPIFVQHLNTMGQFFHILCCEELDHGFIEIGGNSRRAHNNGRDTQCGIFHQFGGENTIGEHIPPLGYHPQIGFNDESG